jgi:sugar lactone lactonase YvrE
MAMNRYVSAVGVVALTFCSIAQAATLDMYVSGGTGAGSYVQKYAYDTSTHAATLDTGFNISGATIDGAIQLAIGPDNRLYVAAQDANAVKWYNRTTGAQVGSTSVPVAGGVGVGPDTTGDGIADMYATSWSAGTVTRINSEGGVSNYVSSGLYHPESVEKGPDGNLYVPSYGANQIYQITTGATPEVFNFITDYTMAKGITFSPDGSYLYSSQFKSPASVFKFDAASGVTLNADWATGSPGGLTHVTNLQFGPNHNGTGGASDLFAVQNYGDNQGKIAVFDGSSGLYINDVVTGLSRPTDILFVGQVPEPGTLTLMVAGLIGLLAYAWRKRK